MLTALALVAASLAVPYLPQTDALCGGAAAAMVFRYWGDAHAMAESFAPLVDRRAGGIADDVLIGAIEARGWRTVHPPGSVNVLRTSIEAGIPVLILVADGRSRFHYVVVTGVSANAVVVHDPSWGPSRPVPIDRLMRIWQPANFWSLIILPRAARLAPDTTGVPSVITTELGELAGMRFAEHRWNDAIRLSQQAVARDPQDRYAWDVLGSSRFILDQPAEALDAWNHADKPRVDAVQIDGLQHARYQIIAGFLGVTPGTLLTADALRLAERRARDLPDQTASAVTYRPGADGFAQVDVAIVEHQRRPRGPFAWAARGAQFAINRELEIDVPGRFGQGDLWSASWRWWAGRPRVAVGFAAPRLGALRGIWRVDASWDSQTYTLSDSTAPEPTETRLHGSLSVSDWLTSHVRYAVSGGVDSWDGARAASLGGSIERHWFGDGLTAVVESTAWRPFNGGPAFHAFGVRLALRSAQATEGWTYRADASADRVSDASPLGLWPGAGDGHARDALLRAHPLLTGGIIDLRAQNGAAFGRTLTHGTVETARWLPLHLPIGIAVAGFADTALTSRAVERGRVFQVDLGAGLRLKVPGAAGVVRIDAAHGMLDGANALSLGWQF